RVMALVLEHLYSRIKPLISIVLVISHAWAEDVDQGKPFVLDRPFQHFNHVFLFPAEGARNISGTTDNGHRDRVNWVLHAPVRRALGFHPFNTRGRTLAGGQAINLVIHHDVGQIDIASHGMNEVISADSVAVAIAPGADYLQLVVTHFHSGR